MEIKELSTQVQKPIIFFDGVCVLCNRFVNYVIERDHKKVFLFAPLQGETAKRLLGPEAKQLKTVMLFQDNKIYKQTDAIIEILPRLGAGQYQLSVLLKQMPIKARDLIYKLVSKTRYRVFGKNDQCRLPSEDERDRFLD